MRSLRILVPKGSRLVVIIVPIAVLGLGGFSLRTSADLAGSTRTPTETLGPISKTNAAYDTAVAQTQAAIATRVATGSMGAASGSPTRTPYPYEATSIQIITNEVLTQDALALTPSPTLDWALATAHSGPPPAPDFSSFVHRLTDAGVIIWQGQPEVFYVCYKQNMDEMPAIVNEWRATDGPSYPSLEAYAGALHPGDAQGVLLVTEHGVGDRCLPESYLTPFRAGAVEVVDAQGHRLLLRSKNGSRVIYFDLDSRQFLPAPATSTPTRTPTPVGGPRPPSRIEDYVLFAQDSLALNLGVQIEAGNIGVNDPPAGDREVELWLGANIQLSPSTTLSADTVSLGPGVKVPGIVFCNDLRRLPSAAVTGKKISPLQLPAMPQFSVPADAPDLVIPPEEGGLPWAETVAGKVTIMPGAVVVLGSGVHTFRNLSIQHDGRLECAGPCELRVVEEVMLGPRAYLGPSQVLPASDLLVYIAGNRTPALHAAAGSSIRGQVYSPMGNMRLGMGGTFVGSFVAKSIWALPGAVFRPGDAPGG